MMINEYQVHSLRPFLVNAKGPAREPVADLLAVWETAADPDERGMQLRKV